MSWAVEEWKDGLPGKALQKIQELEVQLDKLKKERTQKQFQLDSLEAALQKQKQKVDSERTETSALKRENQSLVESCDSLEKARQKVAHELGVKEQQFTMDCKLCLAFIDNRLEELQEKYSQEVEERKRLETELRVLQVKLLNQSSVGVSHKDIAARQAGSSIFPWQQQDSAHRRQSQDIMETPLKRRGTSLWDAHEETPIKPSQRMSSSRAPQSPSGSSQQMEQLKTLNQELRGRVSELERNLANQEKEIRNQTSKLQELQTQLNQARKDLNERDRDLAKTRHELSQATDRHQQAESKCSSVEQKLKQVTEEMSCQRHNAESCRRALEQKLKDQERDSQKELAQLQSSHHALDQQLNQTRTKLTQEVQQAKKDYNVLHADMEKMCSQKKQLEKEMEEQKQKLLRSEQSLQACQTKEQDLRKKMEELQREKNSMTVQLDQSSRRLSQLEEEKKSSDQSLKRTQGLLDDLKAKSEGQTEELKKLQSKLEQQTQASTRELGNLKKALCDAETRNDRSQNELQKQKQEMERLSNRLMVLEKESQELKSNLTASQNECKELKREHQALLDWKKEKETLINETEEVQKEFTDKINNLESSLGSLNKANDELKNKLTWAEGEKASLSAHIDSLKGELLNKCTELEEKEHQYKELQSQFSEAGQKHTKDLENVGVQVAQLEAQVKDLELRLQKEITRAELAERMNTELQDEHKAACDLVRSKEQLVELGQAEIGQLRESLAQTTVIQHGQTEKINSLLEQISSLEEKVDMNKDAAEKLPVLKNELDVVTQSNADLKKSLEALEKNHSSTLEIKSNLENTLAEKINLISALEGELKDVTEKMRKESESHALETENFLKKEKSLEEQLEATKKSVSAAKAESNLRREEIRTMKATLSAASHGLEERDNTIKSLKEKLNKAEAEQAKSSELLKEKVVAMNKIKVQLEMLQMDLEDNETAMTSFDTQVEELKVSTLEARLDEVQSQNSLLESKYDTAKEELFERTTEITRLEEEAARRSQLEENSNLNQLLQEKINLETSLKQLMDGKEHVETEIVQVNAEKKQLEVSVDTMSEENKQLLSRIKQLTEEKEESEAKINEMTVEKHDAESALSQLTEAKAQLDVTLKKTNEENVQLADKLRTSTSEKSDLVTNLNQVVEEKAQLEFKYNQLSEENIKLQSSVNQGTEEKLQLQELIRGHEDEVASLREENHKSNGGLKLHDFSWLIYYFTLRRYFRLTISVPFTFFLICMHFTLNVYSAQTEYSWYSMFKHICLSTTESSPVKDELNRYKEMIRKQENELETLRSEFDLLSSDLELRKELTSELELKIALDSKKSLSDELTHLSEDKETLTLQLQTAKCQLTDVMEMVEGLEMAKGGWDEKFLQQESELKRVRSEKANLEQHILGMESELETMQAERARLKDELETQRRTFSGMAQQIETLMTEVSKLRSELVSCSEERDELSQSLSHWREKVHSLEKNNCDTRNLISILEDDIRAGRKEYEALQSSTEKLKTERQQLVEQVKELEQAISQHCGEREELIGHLHQIKEDHNSSSQNTESMAGKIKALEGEVLRLSQSLESSLLEKGEIASRLNSTQDEVQQMRTGIEKLQVRIESDERKKKKMGELLKAAQRKSDSLQDRIDSLEREKEDVEQSFEEAVLQAETAKAELEEERRKNYFSSIHSLQPIQVSELTSRAARLTKEKDSALSKMSLWMKTCKQLEQEKEMMLNSSGKKTAEETKSELDEVNKLLEEKSKEADESMEKYCSLMVEVHKLEETNDALKTRLDQISQRANDSHPSSTEGRRRSGRKSSARHQEEKMDDNTENTAPSTTQGSPLSSGKRGHREISNKDSAQEALHNLTKRIKASAMTTPKSRAEQEDEEFRPEGLPELVQRGFADIPLGEMSPFIIRRTTVRRCSPRLAAKHSAPDGKVSKAGISLTHSFFYVITLQHKSHFLLCCVSHLFSLISYPPHPHPQDLGSTLLQSPSAETDIRSPSSQKTPEQTQQGDNCHVQ
uniref:Centromere protein F n=1 Tax=Amphilophus citrinellus TaxID=61819 RepID=A0A3Q0RL32_AMPCI